MPLRQLGLVFLLCLICSVSSDCDIYNECNNCAVHGCAWCSSTEACQATTANTTNCGCVKTNIAQGSQCSSQLCGTYPFCYGCVAGGCGWCEDTQTCVESKPLSLPAGPCTTSDCPNTKCWKNTFSNDYASTKCTNAACTSWFDCYDCVANGCAWCEGSQLCLPSNTDGSSVCGTGNSCNNSAECLKNLFGQSYYTTKCPQISCSQMPNCRACLGSGCGWCDSTQQCQPVTKDGSDTCDPKGCDNASQCFKSVLSPDSDPFKDKCTVVDCTARINCQDCASEGCGWCESSQSCLPLSSNSLEVCGSTQCQDSSACLKSNPYGLSNESKCTGSPCSAFNANCFVCVSNGCGWCALTQQCVPSQVPGNGGPCGQDCDASTGCWKYSSNTIYQESKCAPVVCSSINNCGLCTSSGCGWCAWNNTCADAQFFPNSVPQSPGPCPTGTCPNQEKCWKTDTSQQCGLGLSKCSTSTTCRSCVTTPDVSCGWCHSERKCGELSTDASEVCANCNQEPWNIINNLDGCFDCNFDACTQGSCNKTTGTCICPPNYYGPSCSVYCSSQSNCSGNGQCTLGLGTVLTCTCNEFYYGNICQYSCNPAINCSSHGACVNVTGGNGADAMTCQCENKWEYYDGANCSLCPAPYFGKACNVCCDEVLNCSRNGKCVNCSCQCFEIYTGVNCTDFIGIYPIHAWEITIGLFAGLAIATVVTCILISGQLNRLNPKEFPGVIYLTKFTNIISIGVSLVAYGQLIIYAFKPPQSWLPDSTGNSTSSDSMGQPDHLHLPFNITLPEIAYPIWFWLSFGTCVFWFCCAMWVIISARFGTSLNRAVHAFILDLILTCVWPGIGSGLYFPIMEILFAAFNCKYTPHSPKMYLIADQSIVCWEGQHVIYLALSGVALILYYPLCLRVLPLSQSMKEHYTYYRNHIVYQPKFLIFEAQIKLLILLTKMFFSSHFDDYQLYTSISLFICILMLFLLTFIMQPCASSSKVNLWRCVGYIIVLCAVAANFTIEYFPSNSYIPSMILVGSWIVVLFFSVFLHRALFHANTTLSKYWSVSADVRRGAEHQPLLSSTPTSPQSPSTPAASSVAIVGSPAAIVANEQPEDVTPSASTGTGLLLVPQPETPDLKEV